MDAHLRAGSHLNAVNEFPRQSSNSHKASRLISPCRQIFTCCKPKSPSFIFTRSLLGIIRVFYPYLHRTNVLQRKAASKSCSNFRHEPAKFPAKTSMVQHGLARDHLIFGQSAAITWMLVPFLGIRAIKAFYFTSIAKINQANYSKEKYPLFLSSFKTEHIYFLKDPRTDYSMALRE